MKKLLLLLPIISLLTGCQQSASLGVIDKYAKTKSDLTNLERNHKKTNNKYETVENSTSTDGTVTWVDEYESSKGQGYQVYIKHSDGSIESYGEGPESLERSFTATSTN